MIKSDPWIGLSGAIASLCLLMVLGLISIIVWNGCGTFWPKQVELMPLRCGDFRLGEIHSRESYEMLNHQVDQLDEASRKWAKETLGSSETLATSRQFLRIGNGEIFGQQYAFVSQLERATDASLTPKEVWVVERRQKGPSIGFPVAFKDSFRLEPSSKIGLLKFGIEAIKQAMESNGDLVGQNEWSMVRQLEELYLKDRSDAIRQWFQSKPNLSSSHFLIRSRESVSVWDKEEIRQEDDAEWVVSDPAEMETALGGRSAELRRRVRELKLLELELDKINRLKQQLVAAAKTSERKKGSRFLESLEALIKLLDQRSLDSYKVRARVEKLRLLSESLVSPTYDKLFEVAVGHEKKVYEANDDAITAKVESVQSMLEAIPGSRDPQVLRLLDAWVSASEKRLALEDRVRSLRSMDSDGRLVLAVAQFQPTQSTETLPDSQSDNAATRGASFKDKMSVPWNAVDGTDSRLKSYEEADAGVCYGWSPQSSDGNSEPKRLRTIEIPAANVVRAYRPNQLTFAGKLALYLGKWWEFLFENPREANSEGGVFPAIWGTIVLTITMSLMVIPLGVMAALYLAEYSKPGPLTSLVRICINNLAGVPSIVYGAFGLAFFCHGVGAFIDGGPERMELTPLAPPIWFLALGCVVVLGTIAFLASLPSRVRNASRGNWWSRKSIAGGLWLFCVLGSLYLIVKTPFFEGFYQTALPQATFGHRAILWASMTMALLTLPVVIVATEEAIAAVPASLREGSYACGASKWQTVLRIVMPHARSGILTGSILAVARGTGEVAPLMLVGALPSAIDLPLDTEFPFYHGSRGFMHLGFQIFTLGFQSQNSDASRPMVFTTTLLLILIVTMLNSLAVWTRYRLKASSTVQEF